MMFRALLTGVSIAAMITGAAAAPAVLRPSEGGTGSAIGPWAAPFAANGNGATGSASPADRAGLSIDLVHDYRAACDIYWAHTTVTTSNTNTVTFSGAGAPTFTAADATAHKLITVSGIGTGGQTLASTISVYNSPTSVDLATPWVIPAAALPAVLAYGSDDVAGINAANLKLGSIILPAPIAGTPVTGVCGVGSQVTLTGIGTSVQTSGPTLSYRGQGRWNSRIIAMAPMNAVFREDPTHYHTTARIRDLTVDANGLANYAYDVAAGPQGDVGSAQFVNGLLADLRTGDGVHQQQNIFVHQVDMSKDPTIWPKYPVTAVSGTASPYTFTATGIPVLPVGSVLTLTGNTPNTLNGTYTITASSAGSFTATTTATGTWASGGTVQFAVSGTTNLLNHGSDNQYTDVIGAGASFANFQDTTFGGNFFSNLHGYGPAQFAFWFTGRSKCVNCEVDGASVAGVHYEGGGNSWIGGSLFFLAAQINGGVLGFDITPSESRNTIVRPSMLPGADHALLPTSQYLSNNNTGGLGIDDIEISGASITARGGCFNCLIGVTTDDTTAVVLTLNGGVQAVDNIIPLGNFSVVNVTGLLCVRDTNNGLGGSYNVNALFTKGAAGATPVMTSGSLTANLLTPGFTLNTAPTISASSSAYGSFNFTVKGVAAHELHWRYVPSGPCGTA